ncbi:MAG: L-lactate permease [Clostridiales Family XIII bacterium]|jgi:lactate permease|nr:L-lactate permease [Clostridiales Family XIII bacterium]
MNDIVALICAIVPIAWLFIAMCLLRLPGHITCPAGLVIAAILAFFVWKRSASEIGSAALEGCLFALWPILLVVIATMILFRYSEASGGMDRIRSLLTGVSSDRRVLVLVLAWGFGGFLEGIAGFGIPVLIPGAILVALGFSPMSAVVVCLVANTAPTPFAQIGIPVLTLSGVTGLDAAPLGAAVATQLFLPCLVLPFLLVIITGKGLRAVNGVFLITLISGLSFALPMLLLAHLAGPGLPTLAGSICAITCTIVANRLLYKDTETNRAYQLTKKTTRNAQEKPVAINTCVEHMASNAQEKPVAVNARVEHMASNAPAPGAKTEVGVLQACFPFILVFVLVLATNLIPAVADALAPIRTVRTFYTGAGARPLTFSWILTPGVLILIATVLSCFIQRQSFRQVLCAAGAAVISSRNMILTVLSIIAMAKVMSYSGMTAEIAAALVMTFGIFYPLIAPVIGALGTFITGSDTTCCVLFGELQVNAATAIGADPTWIAASNLSGAAIGKMISPQSIAVSLGVGGLDGKEGAILKQTLRFSLIVIPILIALSMIAPM